MAGYGVALVACLAALVHVSSAATYTVGGSTGWAIPASSSLYSSWAAKQTQQTFKVGDSLVFNFQTGAHTVAEVSKSAYDACTTTNPITTFTTGPATVNLSTAGAHYYICTIPGHCSAGQRLAITASAAASPKSSSAPKSSGSPVTAPSPASAAPTPSSSSSSPAASPASGATSPASSTTPSTVSSTAGGPSSSTTPASPSSGTAAAAGLAFPILLIGAAFLF